MQATRIVKDADRLKVSEKIGKEGYDAKWLPTDPDGNTAVIYPAREDSGKQLEGDELTDLEPCEHCGNTPKLLEYPNDGGYLYAVSCVNCKYSLTLRRTIREAVDTWNWRNI